jgi:N-acetylmuramic acid 6-phosphate (MurNAc-6-P) etherase
MSRAVTESQNPLTMNIDVVDQVGLVRLLRQSDTQMFSGFDVWAGVNDEEILEAMARAAWRMSRLLTGPENRVYMSGAGTSGRLAHLLSLEFNRVLKDKRLPEIMVPLMAGGEPALIQAQEAAEDSVTAAVRDLQAATPQGLNRAMYIGITAGLSAPYVGAQLDAILPNKKFDSVLLGFNPLSLARTSAIEGWDKTVKSVIDKAVENERFTLVNPVYGPESITGSTRMKGGSMTKIAIETIFATALRIVLGERGDLEELEDLGEENLLPLRDLILKSIDRYRATVDATYRNIDGIAELVRLGGTALRSSGRIHYIGRGVAGLIGIIDASECPPTFGADLYDVRGYLYEGWEMLGFNSATMKARGRAYEIGHDYFENEVLPDISKGDLVVGIAVQVLGENTKRLLVEAAKRKAKTALVFVGTELPKAGDLPESLTHRCIIRVPTAGFTAGINNEAELALKLTVNALTTGAHVMAGKVFGNVMIDLRISNSKLYDRAVGLISNLASVSLADGKRALHMAIFKEKVTDEKLADVSIAMSVQRAVTRMRIVPLAIILATGRFGYEEAQERLDAEPRVRRIIEDIVSQTQA